MEVSKARDNSQGAEGSGKLFTGVLNMAVTAVNPTKSEMEAMGMKPKDEPDYFLKDKDDKSKIIGYRLAFFLEGVVAGEKARTILNIYLRKQFVESKKEGMPVRHQFIDKFGKTCFEEKADVDMKAPKSNWVDADSLKLAVSGEPELVEFIRCYLGHLQQDVCRFTPESLRDIFAGKAKVIRDVIEGAKKDADNMVRVMLGVRDAGDGKFYQTVYGRKFERPYAKNSLYIHKSLAYSKGEKDVDFGVNLSVYNEADFKIKEYNPSSAPATAPHPSMVSDVPGSSDIIPALSADDLPF